MARRPVSVFTALILFVALVLSSFVPAAGMWPLFALVLDDRLENLWLRVRHRR